MTTHQPLAQGSATAASFLPSSSSSSPQTTSMSSLPGKGGLYIPPHRLRAQTSLPTSPSSPAYQQHHWELLRRSLNGLVNKLNGGNLPLLLPQLFSENLVRGRGLLVRAIMKAQLVSPSYTAVYASLVNIVNSKLPEVGLLLVHRLLITFRRAFTRNDKHTMSSTLLFLSHLFNQRLLHELTILELATLLLETPTDDSVEVCCELVTSCGKALQEASAAGMLGITERLRQLLHEGVVSQRVQYVIERVFELRRRGWGAAARVEAELDLVEEADIIVHEVSIDDPQLEMDNRLNSFQYDERWEENELEYQKIKEEILGQPEEEEQEQKEGSADAQHAQQDADGSASITEEKTGSDDLQAAPPAAASAAGGGYELTDMTESDVINLRRTIYLSIMSSLSYEETAHKLLKMGLSPQQQPELVSMIIECTSMEKTYLPFYGSLLERFCRLDARRSGGSQSYRDMVEEAFVKHYAMIHRLETNRIRNVARLFAHVLAVDAVSWEVLSCVRLTEEDTTSAGRIFLKILLQEVVKALGMETMKTRLSAYWQSAKEEEREIVSGLMPRDSAKSLRFSINYFTSIGLGALTEDMREELKQLGLRMSQQQDQQIKVQLSTLSDGSSSSDDSSSGSSDSSSDDDSSGSESESSSASSISRKSSSSRSDDSDGSRRHSSSRRRSSSDRRRGSIRDSSPRDRRSRNKRSGSDSRERRPPAAARDDREAERKRTDRAEEKRRDGSPGRERRRRDGREDDRETRVKKERTDRDDRAGERRRGDNRGSRSPSRDGLRREDRARRDRRRSRSRSVDSFGRDRRRRDSRSPLPAARAPPPARAAPPQSTPALAAAPAPPARPPPLPRSRSRSLSPYSKRVRLTAMRR